MKIHNIKVSYYFSDDLVKRQKSNSKVIEKYSSGICTTIYKHTPNLINCTGIKHREQIDEIKCLLENKFQAKCANYRIDNTFIQEKYGTRLNLMKVFQIVASHYHYLYTPSYDPEIFSGLCMKSKDKTYPTINVFSTGTVQYLAGKSFRCIQQSRDIIRQIIREIYTTKDNVDCTVVREI